MRDWEHNGLLHIISQWPVVLSRGYSSGFVVSDQLSTVTQSPSIVPPHGDWKELNYFLLPVIKTQQNAMGKGILLDCPVSVALANINDVKLSTNC